MNKEIEIKLSYKNKEEVITKLKKAGAHFREKYELHDTYFSHADSMVNAQDFIRIRKKDDFCELTYKGKKEEKNGIWERTEINVKIEDNENENMNKILTHLQLMRIKENKSTREFWMINGAEVCFTTFTLPNELNLIEIEADTADKVQEIVNLLGNSVEKVGEEFFKKLD